MVAICKKRSLKVTIFLLVCICGFIHYGSNFYNMDPTHPAYNELDQKDWSLRLHLTNVENFYRNRQNWPSSKLGGILFKREQIPEKNPNANKTFVILMWEHWDWLKTRHVYRFGSASSRDNVASALSYCTVNNCIFSGEDNLIDTADAVVVHLQNGVIPKVKNRNPKQRWIFLTDESPRHTFSLAKKKLSLEDLNNVFNWSMTYRSDADIPVPYGRAIPLDDPFIEYLHLTEIASLVPNWGKKRRDVAATILMSNCGVKARNDLLTKFKKYIQVDVYGGCSDKPEYKKSCPGHFTSDCELISRYKFYLVLENSSCFQYLTEKIFYHAYAKGAVPIIWGPAFEDVESLLPPHSFLYVDKDTNIEKLAMDIKALNQNDELMLSMHMWRNHFQIVNEHGYFGSKSYHLCRLCEAMNYNDEKEKTYSTNDLRLFLDPKKTCLN